MSEPEPLPSEEIRRRLIEKAALVAELESRLPKPEGHAAPSTAPARAVSLTAEPAILARLVRKAARTEKRATVAAEVAAQCQARSLAARQDLDAYMRENGLA